MLKILAALLIGVGCGVVSGRKTANANYEDKLLAFWAAVAAATLITATIIVASRIYDYAGTCSGSIGDPPFPCTLWQYIEDDLRTYSLIAHQALWNAAGAAIGLAGWTLLSKRN